MDFSPYSAKSICYHYKEREELIAFLKDHAMYFEDGQYFFPELLDKLYQNYNKHKANGWQAKQRDDNDVQFEREMDFLYRNENKLLDLQNDADIAVKGIVGTDQTALERETKKNLNMVEKVMNSPKLLDQVLERTENLADVKLQMDIAKAKYEALQKRHDDLHELVEEKDPEKMAGDEDYEADLEKLKYFKAVADAGKDWYEARQDHVKAIEQPDDPAKARSVRDAGELASEAELALRRLDESTQEDYLAANSENGGADPADAPGTAAFGGLGSIFAGCSTARGNTTGGGCAGPDCQGVGSGFGVVNVLFTSGGSGEAEQKNSKYRARFAKGKEKMKDQKDEWKPGDDGGFIGVEKSKKDHWFAYFTDPTVASWIHMYSRVMKAKDGANDMHKKLGKYIYKTDSGHGLGDRYRWEQQHGQKGGAIGSVAAGLAARQRAKNFFEMYKEVQEFMKNKEDQQYKVIIETFGGSAEPLKSPGETKKEIRWENTDKYLVEDDATRGRTPYSVGTFDDLYEIDEEFEERILDQSRFLRDWYDQLVLRIKEKFGTKLDDTDTDELKEAQRACGDIFSFLNPCSAARTKSIRPCGDKPAGENEHRFLEEFEFTDPDQTPAEFSTSTKESIYYLGRKVPKHQVKSGFLFLDYNDDADPDNDDDKQRIKYGLRKAEVEKDDKEHQRAAKKRRVIEAAEKAIKEVEKEFKQRVDSRVKDLRDEPTDEKNLEADMVQKKLSLGVEGLASLVEEQPEGGWNRLLKEHTAAVQMLQSLGQDILGDPVPAADAKLPTSADVETLVRRLNFAVVKESDKAKERMAITRSQVGSFSADSRNSAQELCLERVQQGSHNVRLRCRAYPGYYLSVFNPASVMTPAEKKKAEEKEKGKGKSMQMSLVLTKVSFVLWLVISCFERMTLAVWSG